MRIKNFILCSCFLIPFFILQVVQAQNMESSSSDTVIKKKQTSTIKFLLEQIPTKYGSMYLDKVTEEEQTTIARLSLNELLELIKKYYSMENLPSAHLDYALSAIFHKDDWLAAVDPLLEIYSSSPGGGWQLVQFLSGLCTTKEMPPQFIDKIQDTFLSDLEKGTAIDAYLRSWLVTGLFQSVHRPWLSDTQKKALRTTKGIDPDAPLRGTDKIVSALIKALDDENYYVRMNAVGGLQMIGVDTSIEDVSILPALEARRKVEENQFINSALDRAISKLQKKAAASADKKENN